MPNRNVARGGCGGGLVDGSRFQRLSTGMAFALALFLSGAVIADTRVALVIGNADYGAMGRLENPANDAHLIARTLRDFGFRVIEIIDADQKELKRGVRDFGRWIRRAGPDGVALFYYAGHGLQVSGRNYLLPVEAQILAEGDVAIEGVAVDGILAQMEHANTGVNIVILDACRNNPFQRGFRSASSGLARMEAPTGTYIAYSTAPGQLAMEGDGPNSPFTLSLANAMKQPGWSIEKVFKTVRQEVARISEERQIPWSSSSLIGNFSFHDGPQAQGTAAAERQQTETQAKRDELAVAERQERENELEAAQRAKLAELEALRQQMETALAETERLREENERRVKELAQAKLTADEPASPGQLSAALPNTTGRWPSCKQQRLDLDEVNGQLFCLSPNRSQKYPMFIDECVNPYGPDLTKSRGSDEIIFSDEEILVQEDVMGGSYPGYDDLLCLKILSDDVKSNLGVEKIVIHSREKKVSVSEYSE